MNKKQKIKRSQKILCAVFLAAAVICGGIGTYGVAARSSESGSEILSDMRLQAILDTAGTGAVDAYVEAARAEATAKAREEGGGMEAIREATAAAEEEAARIKAEAQKRAQELVADAEREARALSERTEEELKAYRDEQAKRAGAEASAEYDAAVAAARREAEAETSRLLENTNAAVGRIAGRILSDR